MANSIEIEEQIRRLLATESSGIVLSNKLFSPPNGLFCILGETEEERRRLIQTPLFREAQARITELSRQEAAAFSRLVKQVEGQLAPNGYRVKLEQMESK